MEQKNLEKLLYDPGGGGGGGMDMKPIRLWRTKKNRALAINSLFQTSTRTCHQIYRLVLPLRSPETLSLLRKSRISLFNVHLALIVQRMTQLWSHNPIGKCCFWRASETSETLSGQSRIMIYTVYIVRMPFLSFDP